MLKLKTNYVKIISDYLLTEWKKDINHISVDIDVNEKLLWVKEDNKELFFADLYFLK